jgi:Spy/CpxP family protein refolding chaperone
MVVATVAAALLVASGAWAQGPGMGMGPGAGMGAGPGKGSGMRIHRGAGGMHAMMKELDLTEAQQDKAKDIFDRQSRKNIAVEADLKTAHLDMRKLMDADTPDKRAIEAQIDKVSGLRAQLQKNRMAGLLEFRDQLTPAQLKKMKELRQDFGRGRGRGMGFGPGPGGGMGPMGFDFDDEGPEDDPEGF